jgi:hypothetical protein
MDTINALRKSLKDVAGYKNVGLSKSLGLFVLQPVSCCSLLSRVSLALCSSELKDLFQMHSAMCSALFSL